MITCLGIHQVIIEKKIKVVILHFWVKGDIPNCLELFLNNERWRNTINTFCDDHMRGIENGNRFDELYFMMNEVIVNEMEWFLNFKNVGGLIKSFKNTKVYWNLHWFIY